MRELEVVLAIALSFLIFSTLASMVLEFFYRMMNTRFNGLKTMLSDYYKQELSSFAQKHKVVHTDSTSDSGFTEHFLAGTNNNPLLSTATFIERLAQTELGTKIADNTKAEVDLLISHFARQFDHFGESAKQSFRKNSEKYTLYISIVMALLFNINVLTLGHTFLENRTLTENMVAQTSSILEQAEAQNKQLKETLKDDKQQSAEQLQQVITRLNKQYDDIKSLELPVGWSTNTLSIFESFSANLVCETTAEHPPQLPLTKAACKTNMQQGFFWIIALISWFISTLITGLFIGLGGPFWFDIIKRINVFRTVLGAVSTAPKQPQTQQTETDIDTELVTLFEKAVKAKELLANISKPNSPPAPALVRLG